MTAILTTPVPFAGIAPDPSVYDPGLDGDFWHDVFFDLLSHFREWRHPGRVILERRGGDCDAAVLSKATGRVVDALRRLGLVVEGDTVLGYRLVDCRRARWIRPDALAVWPPEAEHERHERRGEIDGQLAIVEGV